MDTLVSLGYWGLFIGSFLASTIIPMSADVLLVGVLALGGNVWGCLAIATVGNWLGGLTSYWIGWLGRWDWIERWFKVKREKLEQQKGHVDRYGVWLALFTWLPIVGDLFAIALGIKGIPDTGYDDTVGYGQGSSVPKAVCVWFQSFMGIDPVGQGRLGAGRGHRSS